MKLQKEEKKRIMKFITYYRSLTTKNRGVLIKLISEACSFKGGTFHYKLTNKNYSQLQIETIEKIVTIFKGNHGNKEY